MLESVIICQKEDRKYHSEDCHDSLTDYMLESVLDLVGNERYADDCKEDVQDGCNDFYRAGCAAESGQTKITSSIGEQVVCGREFAFCAVISFFTGACKMVECFL